MLKRGKYKKVKSENQQYVYCYLDPRRPGKFLYSQVTFLFEPFYIGTGKRFRIFSYSGRNKWFHKKILKITNSGEQPICFKLHENISTVKATELEQQLISQIGRMDKNLGPLVNLTDGGEGTLGFSHIAWNKGKKGLPQKQKSPEALERIRQGRLKAHQKRFKIQVEEILTFVQTHGDIYKKAN